MCLIYIILREKKSQGFNEHTEFIWGINQVYHCDNTESVTHGKILRTYSLYLRELNIPSSSEVPFTFNTIRSSKLQSTMRRSVLGTTSLRMHFLSFPSLLESNFDWRSSFLFWRFSFRFCLSKQINQSSKCAASSAEVLCCAHKCRLLGPKWLSCDCDSLNSACCLHLCHTETSTKQVKFCKYLQRQTSDTNSICSINTVLGVSWI